MADWQQRGFVVVSMAGTLPLHHGFYLPKWEADMRMEEVKKLPAEFQDRLQVVPAVLHFELPNPTDAKP